MGWGHDEVLNYTCNPVSTLTELVGRSSRTKLPSRGMDSDDDELQRAIQLSLHSEQESGAKRRIDVVDLTAEVELWPGFEDTDEMELWKAIAVSMGEGISSRKSQLIDSEPSYEICIKHKRQNEADEGNLAPENQVKHELPSFSKPELVLSDTASEDDTASEEDEELVTKKVIIQPEKKVFVGLGGLNRAQMERERLERAKRSGIPPPLEPPRKRIRTENINESSPTFLKNTGGPSLQFPEGTIKWTYVVGYPKEPHHITIEDVLQKDTLKAAVLSGFQVRSSSYVTDVDRLSLDSE